MIQLPIEIGDTILRGKFRNRRVEVKEIGTDEHGQPTINGETILKIRIEKLNKQESNMGTARLEKAINEAGLANFGNKKAKPFKKGESLDNIDSAFDNMAETLLDFLGQVEAYWDNEGKNKKQGFNKYSRELEVAVKGLKAATLKK